MHEADAALTALEQRLAQADEARRRADDAKTAAEDEVRRLDRELREERGSRRIRDDQSQRTIDAAQRQVDEALAQGERLQRAAEAASQRERRTGEKLRTIEGLPPLLISPPAACRFGPRCPYIRDVCRESEPELTQRDAEGNLARCFATEPGGWIA